MIDFDLDIEGEVQWYHCVFFLVFYISTFWANRKLLTTPNSQKNNNIGKIFLFVSLITLSIVAVTDNDFFHYADMIYSEIDDGYMEPIYYWLSDFVNHNYLLWRILVWGSALFVVLLIFKRLELDLQIVFLILFLCYINLFSYARASLACAVYFLGFTYLIKPAKIKILSYIWGITIILCSHFFHNSIFFLIAITPLIIIPMNKFTIGPIIIIAIALASIAYQYFYSNISYFIGADNYADRFLSYTETHKSLMGDGISDVLEIVLRYGSFMLPFLFLSRRILIHTTKIDSATLLMYKMVIIIIFFAITLGLLTHTAYFFYRLLYMSIIPISALLATTYSKSIISHNEFKLCIYWGIADILYLNSYVIYVWLWY